MAITTEQAETAADKLEALKGDRQAAALRMLPHEQLCALDLEMGGRETAKGRAAYAAVQAERERRAAIRAENEAIAAAKAARRAELDKVAESFAKGVQVFVPGHPGVKGELFCTGRRKAPYVVDLRPHGASSEWDFHDGWDVVWGDRHNRRQVWFSNDQIAAAQIDEWVCTVCGTTADDCADLNANDNDACCSGCRHPRREPEGN